MRYLEEIFITEIFNKSRRKDIFDTFSIVQKINGKWSIIFGYDEHGEPYVSTKNMPRKAHNKKDIMDYYHSELHQCLENILKCLADPYTKKLISLSCGQENNYTCHGEVLSINDSIRNSKINNYIFSEQDKEKYDYVIYICDSCNDFLTNIKMNRIKFHVNIPIKISKKQNEINNFEWLNHFNNLIEKACQLDPLPINEINILKYFFKFLDQNKYYYWDNSNKLNEKLRDTIYIHEFKNIKLIYKYLDLVKEATKLKESMMKDLATIMENSSSILKPKRITSNHGIEEGIIIYLDLNARNLLADEENLTFKLEERKWMAMPNDTIYWYPTERFLIDNGYFEQLGIKSIKEFNEKVRNPEPICLFFKSMKNNKYMSKLISQTFNY